jgi:hypothetical protein
MLELGMCFVWQLAVLAVCLGAKGVLAGSAFTSSIVLVNKGVRPMK